MTGYHYASIENYRKIQLQGLMPYHIDKPDLRFAFPNGFDGVWIWQSELVAEAELGSILWQVFTKGTTTIVKLRVEYDETKLLCFGGKEVEIYHDGRIGNWNYHRGEPAIISTVPIPVPDITLQSTYSLLEMIDRSDSHGTLK